MNPTLVVAGVAGLIAIGWKLLDFLRLLTNLHDRVNRSRAVTQLLAWAVFVGLVFVYSASQYGHGIVLDGVSIVGASVATKVLMGVALGSVAGVGTTLIQALDSSQTAAVPPLLRTASPTEPAPTAGPQAGDVPLFDPAAHLPPPPDTATPTPTAPATS